MRWLIFLLSALKNALLAAADFLFEVLFAPVRALRPAGRSAVPPPPDVVPDILAAMEPTPQMVARPKPTSPASEPAPEVIQFAAACIRRNAEAAQKHAAQLPDDVRTWAVSLGTVELRKVIAARTDGVSAHLNGNLLEGVPPLKSAPLKHVRTNEAPDLEDESPIIKI